ncbi:ATP-grasp fold amidoligase family protein [Neobacillus sp. PS2-9]|uniref:ATP-grasp fold amidoligase family protein n=1 Tax=Neobacillus sp. PS2-9 TaxID=3070676 RepID=UPI0027DF4A48|nr:ATP-grasp fold amidoligase family protein [Neobacillus sp. PS2-9]WML58626.1 ATP-grasp fold amidoligase family protein [Neobacillus sp. PS2-9]
MNLNLLRNNKTILGLYRKGRNALSVISPTLSSKMLYRLILKQKLDLKNPQTMNAKLMWLKLNTYNKNPLITKCVDKYKVREYIQDKGCNEILNDLIGVWDNVEDIDWDALPNQFAIKCNHGCKYNIICDDKSKFDIEEAKKKLNEWMNTEYWRIHAELNYRYIDRKIICERYLNDGTGFLPEDYKFHCFNGKAEYVMICVGREEGHPQYFYFDKDWKMVPFSQEALEVPEGFTIPKPEGIDKMFDYAEKLAGPFPFVRADFYLIEGKTIFGELTFTPGGCLDPDIFPEADKIMGSLIQLPR